MFAYYNEIDPNAAEWIRELIKDGAITDGEVDERSIEDVLPADIRRFARCHFFAGVGAWDYALNLSGWEGQVWTGSCPCQPFSTAGKREGFADERHLWPAWFHLIEQCRPHTVFGEQVASKDGLTWLDLVSADVEGIGYTIGAIDLPVAGVRAPHRRQRFFFGMANNEGIGRRQGQSDGHGDGFRDQPRELIRPACDSELDGMEKPATLQRRGRRDGDSVGSGREIQTSGRSPSIKLDNANGGRCEQRDAGKRNVQLSHAGCPDSGMENTELPTSTRQRQHGGQEVPNEESAGLNRSSTPSRMANATGDGCVWEGTRWAIEERWEPQPELARQLPGGFEGRSAENYWADVEWALCDDPDGAKWRPIKPGTFPLADGIPGRVGLLRGAGNAISPWAAKAFIESWQEVRDGI